MARRHRYEFRARTPYAKPGSGGGFALVVPPESDLAGALCAQVAPEVFFPEPDEGEAAEQVAKSICSACPVRLACLNLAMARGDRYGVFGGLTAVERDALAGRTTGCGTRIGYRRHRDAEEPACLRCLAANAADKASRKAMKNTRRVGSERSDLEAAA